MSERITENTANYGNPHVPSPTPRVVRVPPGDTMPKAKKEPTRRCPGCFQRMYINVDGYFQCVACDSVLIPKGERKDVA